MIRQLCRPGGQLCVKPYWRGIYSSFVGDGDMTTRLFARVRLTEESLPKVPYRYGRQRCNLIMGPLYLAPAVTGCTSQWCLPTKTTCKRQASNQGKKKVLPSEFSQRTPPTTTTPTQGQTITALFFSFPIKSFGLYILQPCFIFFCARCKGFLSSFFLVPFY